MACYFQFAPIRAFNDLIGIIDNYSMPNFNDISLWCNRLTNNLLYYQTNYLLFFLVKFILIGYLLNLFIIQNGTEQIIT